MIRIKWIDPKKEKVPSFLEGEIRGGKIFLVKGKASDLTKAHERAHIALGHFKHRDITPEMYVRGELDAQLYTYKRLKKPVRLITDLRGILLSLKDAWDVPYKRGLKLLSDEVGRRENIPVSWKRDLDKVRKEISDTEN